MVWSRLQRSLASPAGHNITQLTAGEDPAQTDAGHVRPGASAGLKLSPFSTPLTISPSLGWVVLGWVAEPVADGDHAFQESDLSQQGKRHSATVD